MLLIAMISWLELLVIFAVGWVALSVGRRAFCWSCRLPLTLVAVAAIVGGFFVFGSNSHQRHVVQDSAVVEALPQIGRHFETHDDIHDRVTRRVEQHVADIERRLQDIQSIDLPEFESHASKMKELRVEPDMVFGQSLLVDRDYEQPVETKTEMSRAGLIALGTVLVICGWLLFNRNRSRPMALKAVTVLGLAATGVILFGLFEAPSGRDISRSHDRVVRVSAEAQPAVTATVDEARHKPQPPTRAKRPIARAKRPVPRDVETLPPRAGEIPVASELANPELEVAEPAPPEQPQTPTPPEESSASEPEAPQDSPPAKPETEQPEKAPAPAEPAEAPATDTEPEAPAEPETPQPTSSESDDSESDDSESDDSESDDSESDDSESDDSDPVSDESAGDDPTSDESDSESDGTDSDEPAPEPSGSDNPSKAASGSGVDDNNANDSDEDSKDTVAAREPDTDGKASDDDSVKAAPVRVESETAGAGDTLRKRIEARTNAARPDWVEMPGQLTDSVYRVSIKSGLYADVPECQGALEGTLKRYVDDYIERLMGAGTAELVNIDRAYLNEHIKQAEFSEVVISESVGPMHEIHALLEIDDNDRAAFHARWRRSEVTHRLWYVGSVAVVVLALLSTFYGYLKLDQQIAATNKGRLPLAATLVALIVAAGALLARWAVPF